MSRPGITYQEVANAAIQLQGQDENPTVDRVREILGTGSKSTIARYLKDWKSKTEHVAGSNGIPHELISIVKGLWERLKSESDKKITHYLHEADSSLNEIKQSLNQEQHRSKDLQTKLCQIENQLHEEKSRSQARLQSLEEEKLSNVKLSERNHLLSEQLLNQKSDNERLHQLLSHVQNNLEHYQSSVQKQREEQVLSIEKQKTAYDHEVTSLKREILTITAIKDRLQLENQQLKSEITLLAEQKATFFEERNHFSHQLQEKTVNEKSLLLQIKQLKAVDANHQIKIQQQSIVISDCEKNSAILNNQVIQFKKSLEDLEDHVHILRDEKLFLSQEKSHLEGRLKQTEKILLARENKVEQ